MIVIVAVCNVLANRGKVYLLVGRAEFQSIIYPTFVCNRLIGITRGV